MKKYYLVFLTLSASLFTSFGLFAQVNHNVNPEAMRQYEKFLQARETSDAVLKFCDPAFPAGVMSSGKVKEKQKMEEYAKTHPPVPVMGSTGNDEYDNAKYESDLYNWIKLTPFYPQFIPYHLYNNLLTPEDDIKFYELAKKVWIKSNPDKYAEMNNSEK